VAPAVPRGLRQERKDPRVRVWLEVGRASSAQWVLLLSLGFDHKAVVLGVGLQDQFLAGVPAPGPDGLDGEGEGVALAAGDREEGAGVAFGGFSAGHSGGVKVPLGAGACCKKGSRDTSVA
jgi:hypothetical protein